jgi:spermidine synthase
LPRYHPAMHSPGRLGWPTAVVVTFLAAGCVLVIEIAAGRLLAPYVGVSLVTYTGIIGVILAGIALGAWLGGRAADAVGPEPLLGPCLVLGGWAAMASVPIVAIVGGLGLGGGPLAIVILATAAFVLPAMLLSAVGPMLVRASLTDLGTSGSVVGRLSAIGTLGAICGTFLTGFVLLGLIPTRPLLVGVGLVLVVIGLWLTWRLRRNLAAVTGLGIGTLALGALAVALPSPCVAESAYYCIAIDADATSPTGRTLVLDGLTHAYVDTADPTVIRFGYVRRFVDAAAPTIEAAGPEPAILHVGGGGFTFPRYAEATWPGLTQTVLELDPVVLDIARTDLGYAPSAATQVIVGDARRSVQDLPDAAFDVVAADAFGGLAVPWHLTTREFVADLARVMRPDGILVANLIDFPPLGFVRAETATLAERFDHVAVIAGTPTIEGAGGGNVVLVASDAPLDVPAISERIAAWGEPDPTSIVQAPDAIEAFVGSAQVLRDDFAPVDQLLGR